MSVLHPTSCKSTCSSKAATCMLIGALVYGNVLKLYKRDAHLKTYRAGTVNSNTVHSKFHLICSSVKSLPDSYNFMFKLHG